MICAVGQERIMKPKVTNVICAYPMLLSWLIGAAVLDTLVVFAIAGHSSWSVLIAPTLLGSVAFALVPATLLGWFLGMFTCWPFVSRICTRYNGAPFAVGEDVVILGGRCRGTVTKIYETTKGQGGQTLLKLDIGQEMKETHLDLYDEYSITRATKGEQSPAGYVANRAEPEE